VGTVSYYGMRATFGVIFNYLKHDRNPGWGWTNIEALGFMVGIPCGLM